MGSMTFYPVAAEEKTRLASAQTVEARRQSESVRHDRREVETERRRFAQHQALFAVPSHWKTRATNTSEFQEYDVTSSHAKRFEWLFNHTAEPQQHGIGRDSHKGKFQGFRVRRVLRIENIALWRKYAAHRDDVVQRADGTTLPAVDPPVATVTFKLPGGSTGLFSSVNEQYLFHGTKVSSSEELFS